MKIALPGIDWNAQGGGWSFCRNFIKAMQGNIVDYNEADIFFIPSASMVSRDDVLRAQEDKKKIVLRCDNIIRNSRNRNTGMSRMKDFSDWADLVIFQSEFAEQLLNPYLKTEQYKVIYNSVDEGIFNDKNRVDGNNRYYYGKHSSDETKNWEMARVAYQQIQEDIPEARLNLVGRFDGNLQEYNFDFYNNEQYRYWGYITDPHVMANIYQQSDYFIYTYFNDACSNSLIEALMCGMQVYDPYHMTETGGTSEIIERFYKRDNYFTLKRMGDDYKLALARIL